MNKDIKIYLETLSEKAYSDFSTKLIPNARHILGVRIPQLRKYAVHLAKTQGAAVLADKDDFYYEETMLRGMIIGYLKTDTETRLNLIRDFVPQINNWAVCDSFCNTLKFTTQNRERVWDFLQDYFSSSREFDRRFAAVMLLCHYVNEEYIERTLSVLWAMNTTEYYVSMGVAWAAAECFIRFPEHTLPYIKSKTFDKETQNRTIQKIFDSYRVDKQQKEQLKKYK